MRVPTCVAVATLIAASLEPLWGQTTSASRDLAARLAARLSATGSDVIAAAVPGEDGRFAAALYVPGGQLLVVSARTPSVAGVAQHIAAASYREVYSDLQGTPTPEGKFFVVDSGADGIRDADPNEGQVDLVYEDGVHMTMFNGDPRGQKLKAATYSQVLATSDTRYAAILKVLLTAADDAVPSAAGVTPAAGAR